MNGRVTLAEIAKRAGVHVTTVSLALRNHTSLPLSTRQRLQALAEEMQYRPDPALRALAAYRTRAATHRKHDTLAYLTHWDSRWGWKDVPAHGDFFSGASERARTLGYHLDHFWLGEPGMTCQRMSDILYTRSIHGVIVASHRREVDEDLALDWKRFSAVKIDYLPHRPELHNVTNNQCAIIRQAMRRSLAAGYRRIGVVMHREWDFSVDQAWTAGFLCEQYALPAGDRVPLLLFPGDGEADEGTTTWSHDAGSRTCIQEVATSDFRAWYQRFQPEVIITKKSFVERALQTCGLKVPGDVALVDLFLERADGSVAGMRQNHTSVGELAVEILVGQLHQGKTGIPSVPTVTYVEGNWFDGATLPPRTAAARKGSSRGAKPLTAVT